jgi:cytochrome c-type biogenesis protein CcmH/NrfG
VTLVLAWLLLWFGGQDPGQKTVPHQWRLLTAVETYRAGDTAAALETLAADDLETQWETARAITRNPRLAVAGEPAPGPAGPPWTVAMLRAAGALHMEAALDTFERAGLHAVTSVRHVEIGEMFLDAVGRLEERPSDAIRWEWALGQHALSDGIFHRARVLLHRACERYPGQVPLLLACGTVHEVYATVNADTATALRGAGFRSGSGLTRNPTATVLMRARSARTDNLRRARSAFEEVLGIEPSNTEAALRLGRVRVEQGDAEAAVTLLEALVRARNDQRTAYLSRLLFGRAHERLERFDRAAAAFRDAISVLPAQSARLALAYRLHDDGDGARAVWLAEAVAEDRKVEDPWWAYRFGQYWLLDDVLAALRAEARQ